VVPEDNVMKECDVESESMWNTLRALGYVFSGEPGYAASEAPWRQEMINGNRCVGDSDVIIYEFHKAGFFIPHREPLGECCRRYLQLDIKKIDEKTINITGFYIPGRQHTHCPECGRRLP